MPITSLPKRLPLQLPRTFGLPYHGRVVAGSLTLPNSAVITYPQPSTLRGTDGETHLVRVPGSVAVQRSTQEQTDDTAAGRQWRTYAILSGKNRMIGGQELGENHWIYCDPDGGNWVVSLGFEKVGSIEQKLTVTLESSFGRFDEQGASFAMTPRVLGTYTWTPKQPDGDDQSTGDAAKSRWLDVTHSQTGAVTVVNVGAYGIGQPWTNTALTDYPPSGATQYSVGYHDAVKVTLSGSGSLAAGMIGDGISVAFAHLATAPEMYSATTVITYACPDQFFAETEVVSTRTWDFFYAAEPTGTVTHLAMSDETSTTKTWSGLDCPNRIGTLESESTSISSSGAFGGVTVSAEYVDGTGERGLAAYRVHPNVLVIFKMDATASTITQAKVATSGGHDADVTGYSDPPGWQSLTWEPGAGTITFVDGGDAGCYV
jgi:hypothetical protein